jgi:hypothetical protein
VILRKEKEEEAVLPNAQSSQAPSAKEKLEKKRLLAFVNELAFWCIFGLHHYENIY